MAHSQETGRSVRRALWTGLLATTLLGAGAAAAASESAPPPDYRPPDTKGLCPALAEDYLLCSDNSWSANCADFVRAAARLGEIYRSELRQHPGWVSGLQTTIWWGCGEAQLGDLRSLLQRIETPQARALLAEEPYRSLAEPPAPPPERVPDQELDCVRPSTQAERDACAARNLAQAQATHERAFGACQERVAAPLRQELLDAETSWKKLLPLECTGPAQTRDECLAHAYEERTRSIAAMHPECAP